MRVLGAALALTLAVDPLGLSRTRATA